MGRSLTIIVPALNEVENVEAAIRGVLGIMPQAGIEDFEVLAMTCLDRDGKHDGTVDVVRRLIAEEPRIRSIHAEGYQRLGEKYQRAVELATKEHIVLVPGDNENDPSSFADIFRQIGGADMVLSHTVNPEARPWLRRVISFTYTRALNFLFQKKLRYYNGINVYRVQHLREILPIGDSFAYSAEIVLKLLHRQKTYVEVPVRVQSARKGSKALRWDNVKRVVVRIFQLHDQLK